MYTDTTNFVNQLVKKKYLNEKIQKQLSDQPNSIRSEVIEQMKFIKFKSVNNFSQWLEYQELSSLLDNLNKQLSSNIDDFAFELSLKAQQLNHEKLQEISLLDHEDKLNSGSNVSISHIVFNKDKSDLKSINFKNKNKSKKNIEKSIKIKSKNRNKQKNNLRTFTSSNTLSTDTESNQIQNNESQLNTFNQDNYNEYKKIFENQFNNKPEIQNNKSNQKNREESNQNIKEESNHNNKEESNQKNKKELNQKNNTLQINPFYKSYNEMYQNNQKFNNNSVKINDENISNKNINGEIQNQQFDQYINSTNNLLPDNNQFPLNQQQNILPYSIINENNNNINSQKNYFEISNTNNIKQSINQCSNEDSHDKPYTRIQINNINYTQVRKYDKNLLIKDDLLINKFLTECQIYLLNNDSKEGLIKIPKEFYLWDWQCTECSNINLNFRNVCRICSQIKMNMDIIIQIEYK